MLRSIQTEKDMELKPYIRSDSLTVRQLRSTYLNMSLLVGLLSEWLCGLGVGHNVASVPLA